MPTNPKPVKPRRAYALVDKQGNIDLTTVSLKAREAKNSMFRIYWESLRAAGYRCVRVVIEEDCDAM